MGNGSVSLKLHFLSEEPPVVCLAGEARSRGKWAREGIRVCRVGLDSQMWSLGLASVCVSQCRGLTGHVTSYTPPPPQGPRSGPGVLSPMGEGSRPDRSGGWGSHCHSWCPHPQCIWLGGARLGSWHWFSPGGSNMFRQLVLGCVYPTASLPGETIFEKHCMETWACWGYGSSAGDTEAGSDPAPGLLAVLAPLLCPL